MSVNQDKHNESVEQIMTCLGIDVNDLMHGIGKQVEYHYNKGGDSSFYYRHYIPKTRKKSLKQFSNSQIVNAVKEKLNGDNRLSIWKVEFSRPGIILEGCIYLDGELTI